jgi:hypothetical protein
MKMLRPGYQLQCGECGEVLGGVNSVYVLAQNKTTLKSDTLAQNKTTLKR